MENKDRREFIKIAGKALLVTSGVAVFGLTSAKPKVESGENQDEYFSDGYYDDGYYDDGYYDDGYYDDGYYDDGYYDDGYATGMNSIKKESLRLVVAPNPSNGNFELQFSATQEEPSAILINDLAGKTLVNRSVVLRQGMNHIPFESGALPRGMYELKVVTQKGEGSVRLVIVK